MCLIRKITCTLIIIYSANVLIAQHDSNDFAMPYLVEPGKWIAICRTKKNVLVARGIIINKMDYSENAYGEEIDYKLFKKNHKINFDNILFFIKNVPNLRHGSKIKSFFIEPKEKNEFNSDNLQHPINIEQEDDTLVISYGTSKNNHVIYKSEPRIRVSVLWVGDINKDDTPDILIETDDSAIVDEFNTNVNNNYNLVTTQWLLFISSIDPILSWEPSWELRYNSRVSD